MIHYLTTTTDKTKTVFLKTLCFGSIIMGVYHRWFLSLNEWAPMHWIIILFIGFSIFQGLFYAIGLTLFKKCHHHTNSYLAFACIWTLCEWVRVLGTFGNSAGALGYSQINLLPLLQLSSIISVWGLSFICILGNILCYKLIVVYFTNTTIPILKNRSWITFNPYNTTHFYKSTLIYIFIICIAYFLGSILLNSNTSTKVEHISILQGNHAQRFKFDPLNWKKIIYDYMYLTGDSIYDNIPKPSHIIFWPETVIPSLLNKNSWHITTLKEQLRSQTSVIFGSSIKENDLYFNAALCISSDTLDITNSYKKTKLMPFGEYWPLKGFFSSFNTIAKWSTGNDYSKGTKIQLIQTTNSKVSTGICLEAIYPHIFQKGTKQGADFLAVLANNAWFFDSIAAEELFQMSILRAVENNRFLVLASNNGISAVVSNKGQVIQKTILNKEQVIHSSISTGHKKSIFTLLPYITQLICIIIICFIYKIKLLNIMTSILKKN